MRSSMLRRNNDSALMKPKRLKRVVINALDAFDCLTLIPSMSSIFWLYAFSMSTMETAKPASLRAVAARSTRPSVRAVSRTCIHTLAGNLAEVKSFATEESIYGVVFMIPGAPALTKSCGRDQKGSGFPFPNRTRIGQPPKRYGAFGQDFPGHPASC